MCFLKPHAKFHAFLFAPNYEESQAVIQLNNFHHDSMWTNDHGCSCNMPLQEVTTKTYRKQLSQLTQSSNKLVYELIFKYVAFSPNRKYSLNAAT